MSYKVLFWNIKSVRTRHAFHIVCKKDIQVIVLADSNQQLTTQLSFMDGKSSITSTIYTQCGALERLSLWEEIYSLSHDMNPPWLIGGCFKCDFE